MERVYQDVPQQIARPWSLYIEHALYAKHGLRRDVDYVARHDRVQIVDPYTGRIFEERTWRNGLHQAVEAKEGVTITEERRSLARISRQRFYQMYDHLCGMTGTARRSRT